MVVNYNPPFTVELKYDDYFEVGKPHEINCTVYTAEVDSNDVDISWFGPNGVITNDSSSRISVITDSSNYTSTLKFSYISMEEENSSYNCTAYLSGEDQSLSKSFTISKLTSKFVYYHILLYGRCKFSVFNALIC